MAVIAQHVHAEPAPPCERRPELPAALETLILQLLAKDPAARPGSAAEVRDTLARLLECCSSSAALSPESSPTGSPPAA